MSGTLERVAVESLSTIGTAGLERGLGAMEAEAGRLGIGDVVAPVIGRLRDRAPEVSKASATALVSSVAALARDDRDRAELLLWIATRATAAERISASRASSAALRGGSAESDSLRYSLGMWAGIGAEAAIQALPLLVMAL